MVSAFEAFGVAIGRSWLQVRRQSVLDLGCHCVCRSDVCAENVLERVRPRKFWIKLLESVVAGTLNFCIS